MTTQQPTPDSRPPAALAARARDIADEYDLKNQDTGISDGAYAGSLVDELTAKLVQLADELDRYQAAVDRQPAMLAAASIEQYAAQLRADAAAATDDAVAVGLLRAADGLSDLIAGEDFTTAEQPTWLFLLYASGSVEEVSTDGDIVGGWNAPGLYERMVLAGFPLTRDDNAKTFDGIIDIGTDGTRVVTHASDGPHDMGDASELFLDWFRGAVP